MGNHGGEKEILSQIPRGMSCQPQILSSVKISLKNEREPRYLRWRKTKRGCHQQTDPGRTAQVSSLNRKKEKNYEGTLEYQGGREYSEQKCGQAPQTSLLLLGLINYIWCLQQNYNSLWCGAQSMQRSYLSQFYVWLTVEIKGCKEREAFCTSYTTDKSKWNPRRCSNNPQEDGKK